MPRRPAMKSQSTQVWPAREAKNPWKGLSAGTPKVRNPSVGLPPLSQAASWARSRSPPGNRLRSTEPGAEAQGEGLVEEGPQEGHSEGDPQDGEGAGQADPGDLFGLGGGDAFGADVVLAVDDVHRHLLLGWWVCWVTTTVPRPRSRRQGRRSPGRRDEGPAREGTSARRVAEELGGQHGRLRTTLEAQLGEDAGDVVLHRLLGEEHLLGDLPVGQPLGDVAEQDPLLVGERGQLVGRAPGRCGSAPARSPSSPGR